MKRLDNEKGSAAIFLLAMMVVSIVLIVIIVNIARVYVVKHQASTAAQLGAFAATSEILFAVEEAIKDFDKAMIDALEEDETYDRLWDEVEKRKAAYKAKGYEEEEAYIKTLNEMLPSRLGNPILKEFFNTEFRLNPAFSTKIYNTVREIVRENEGNEEHIEIVISKEKYRVEVKTDATYETVASGKYIKSFSKDIPQVGYGPELSFLQYVLY
ncbi:MAG TPA: pilus assembly protein TadG-related protein [Ureibacillus sp.]|nr:pilus assembly protein TadG-related protein [Ureibacillus sp.]